MDLLMFAHLLRHPDHDLDLERTALLLCEPEYPGLDIPGFIAKLDVMGELARIRLDADRHCGPAAADRVLPILRLLYGELGFQGNVSDYYDPRNSFLNEVIDRRTGNPISLAIVFMAVCRRAGVETFGISFPGHFLVGARRRDGSLAVVDPFDGRMVRWAELRALYESATGDPSDIDERYLVPAARRQIQPRSAAAQCFVTLAHAFSLAVAQPLRLSSPHSCGDSFRPANHASPVAGGALQTRQPESLRHTVHQKMCCR